MVSYHRDTVSNQCFCLCQQTVIISYFLDSTLKQSAVFVTHMCLTKMSKNFFFFFFIQLNTKSLVYIMKQMIMQGGAEQT